MPGPPFGEAERRRRKRAAMVHAELAAGLVDLEQALADPAVGGIPVGRVIGWLAHYGPARTNKLLEGLEFPINPTRRCRELTDRQRRLLAQATRSR